MFFNLYSFIPTYYLPIEFNHLFISCINTQNKNIFSIYFRKKGKIKYITILRKK